MIILKAFKQTNIILINFETQNNKKVVQNIIYKYIINENKKNNSKKALTF